MVKRTPKLELNLHLKMKFNGIAEACDEVNTEANDKEDSKCNGMLLEIELVPESTLDGVLRLRLTLKLV